MDDSPLIDDSYVEPECALKLGPFSCFCACMPRSAAFAGSSFWVEKRAQALDGSPSQATDASEGEENDEVAAASSAAQAWAPAPLASPRGSSALAGTRSRQAQAAEVQPAGAPAPAAGAPEAPREVRVRSSGLLAPVIDLFEAAAAFGETPGVVSHLKRLPLLEGLEAFAAVLDKLGGMGSHLLTNTKKLRNSKAVASEEMFKPWMLSELPTHGPAFKGYVDDSAWMGNLWITWTMEFFVEFFGGLDEGKDTKAAIDKAYSDTLYKHHNFFQRTAFQTAVKQLPARDPLFKLIQGQAKLSDVPLEVSAFVKLGRPIIQHLLLVDKVCAARMEERRAKGK